MFIEVLIENCVGNERFIMAELLQTEQTYVKDLEICVKLYYNALRHQSSEFKAQPGLVNKEDILFSNMKDVLDFHKEIFLKELQKYEAMPEDVGHCFVTWVNILLSTCSPLFPFLTLVCNWKACFETSTNLN